MRILTLSFLLPVLSAWAKVAPLDEGNVYLERDGQPGQGQDDPGVAGVLVSNGTNSVRTDANGHYALSMSAGQTIFIVKPAEYAVPLRKDGLPDFWRHYSPDIWTAGSANFELLSKDASKPEPTEVLVFTDTQVKNAQDIDYYQRGIIAPLRGKAGGFDLGITLGDMVDDDARLYADLNAATAQLGIPWLHVPGNHDPSFLAQDIHTGEGSFQKTYGPDTFAWENGDMVFVGLDDVIRLPGQKPAYMGGLRENQFDFLEGYLPSVPKDRLLVIGVHIPLFDASPGVETFRHADRARLFALLKDFPRVLLLSGHTHNQRHVWHGPEDDWRGAQPLHEYNVGAICGAFWSGVKDAAGIPDATMSDGTPNGHATLAVTANGGYSLAWHPLRDPQATMALHAPKVLRQGAYPAWGVYANVLMGDADTRVEYRVDGGEWMPMKKVLQPDPRLLAENAEDDVAEVLRGYDRSPEATPSQHLWRGALPTGLAVGEHRIEVRAFDRWRGEQRAQTAYRLQEAAP